MKKLFCVGLSVFMITMLSSCGNGQGKDSYKFKPALDVNTKCELTVVGDYKNFEALEAEFDRFNDYYPNVYLNYERLEDYNNMLPIRLIGNNKPNIFFSYTWMMGNAAYEPIVSHMEDLSDPKLNLNLDCIRPGLINHTEDNKVLMVPVFSRTYGTLVNKNLFKKAGLHVPETWSDLLNVCASFIEKGYKNPMMGFTKKSSNCLMNTIAYPSFVATLADNPEALQLANDLDPAAGEYMREALTKVDTLIKNGSVNIEDCDQIADDYDKVIKRFFEGDVPMMVCAADTPSGTKKREAESEAFIKSPFDYSFYPIPLTEEGGYFVDSPAREFSVNKNCNNLDMTNEFMRFLVTDKELNKMATAKGLVPPTKTVSFDSIYAPFGKIPTNRIFFPEVLGIKDQLAVQIRLAAYKVGKGEMDIETAIENYGKLK